MVDPTAEAQAWTIPRIPASAGALIRDGAGRVLIVNPTYKPHWTIPGGQIEEGGESPWEACRRETREECGLELSDGRLACVDFLSAKPGREGGMRFLFDCGVLEDTELGAITLQAAELSEYRLATLEEAGELLSGPVGRRVLAAAGSDRCVYLENGRPLASVRA
ncbi:MAG TPA: NUDIX hydrolase [Solirubrobacteraceae bacterium]